MKRVKHPHILLKITLVIVLAIIIVIGLYQFGIIKKDCKEDKECFSKRLKECNPARYDIINNNNYYVYTIKGDKKGACILHIQLKQMGIGTPVDQILAFEGKDMTCHIPKENLEIELENINGLLDYCTGPLKEAIFEHIITKMYGLVLKNMAPIMEELDKTIKNE